MDAGRALECVTRVPAEFAGVGDRYGTIAPGMSATLVLWSGDPFEIGSVVRRAWMDGGEIDLNDRQKRMHGKYLEKELQRTPMPADAAPVMTPDQPPVPNAPKDPAP
jgi:cytosine/adenosine deaminase-related metal-dependent hydrolase